MKRLLIAIGLIFAASLSAGTVVDNANLLSYSELQRLNADIANLPVWIEAHNQLPNSDIRYYGDHRIATLTSQPGVIIVVTTQPRAWRISMYPQKIVSPEATRVIGDRMASDFRRGNFYRGLHDAAMDLSSLVMADTPAAKSSVCDIVAPAPASKSTSVEAEAVPKTEREIFLEEQKRKNNPYLILAFLIPVGGGLAMLGIWIVKKWREEDKRAQAEREAAIKAQWHANELERRKREAQREKELEAARKEAKKTIEAKRAAATPATKRKAKKVWGSYPTQKSREEAVRKYYGSPYYTSSITTDPLMFYLFLYLVTTNDNPVYTPPPPDTSDSYSRRNSSSDSDYSSSSNSSSDSFGSSGGWDSGISSGGGFSSSDSGGSGGSW